MARNAGRIAAYLLIGGCVCTALILERLRKSPRLARVRRQLGMAAGYCGAVLNSSAPALTAGQLRHRAGVLVTGIGLVWLVIAGRLIQLQGWQQQELTQRADRQREVVQEIQPRPGDIYDAHGRLLATSVAMPSLYVVPAEIHDPWQTAQSLAEALGVEAEPLFEKLGRYSGKQFLWVQRRLTAEAAERVRQLDLPKGCWGFRDEYQRVYPQGGLAAQVLGLRDIDGQGRGGVEESRDAQIHGISGQRILIRDAIGKVIDVQDDPQHPVIAGQDISLTLDAVIQLFAERALDELVTEWQPEACCAIVMNPQTGDVLAMASRPTFDPNHPDAAPADAWKNRAIADIYEPGSTLKPIIVAYGLDQGLLQQDDTFNCEWGRYRMGRRLLHDHHPYGHLSLTDVLVKSSNIGMAKIGERLTNQYLYQAVTAFGLGRKSGIELPGELAGIVRPLDQWTTYSTGSIPMGHELATTPLQLITAHAILANGGMMIRPRILRETSDSGSAELRRLVQPTIAPDWARWIVQEPMRQVVVRGTGKRAQLDDVDVFGKTGTAQCLSPQGGYLHGKYISSFVCGAPAGRPRVLVLVVINQASGSGGETFGGRIAAPVAARILKDTLGHLPPDEGTPIFLGHPEDATGGAMRR